MLVPYITHFSLNQITSFTKENPQANTLLMLAEYVDHAELRNLCAASFSAERTRTDELGPNRGA
jgi:hypothetical protein